MANIAEKVIDPYLNIRAANHYGLHQSLRVAPLNSIFRAVVRAPLKEELQTRYLPQLVLRGMGLENNKAAMIIGSIVFAYMHNSYRDWDGKIKISTSSYPLIHGFAGSYLWQTVEEEGLLPGIAVHAGFNAASCVSSLVKDSITRRRSRKWIANSITMRSHRY